MRIPSGVTDQVIYFVAVDATDFTTRETGLSSFTVYRSRNGGAATAMTTPTVTEVSAANMPGVYKLLLDEDMTIDAGDDSQEMCFHITHAGMAPVTRTIEIYRPKITAGNTLDVTATGAAGIDWGNVENKTTANALTGTTIATTQQVDVNTIKTQTVTCSSAVTVLASVGTAATSTAQTGDSFARIGATGSGLTSLASQASVDTIDGIVDAILLDTAEIGAAGAGLTALASQASVDTIDGIVDAILVDTGNIVSVTDVLVLDGDSNVCANIRAINDVAFSADANGTAAGFQKFFDVAAPTATMTLVQSIYADTNEMQGDLVNGGRLDLILDAILADSNELQTDWQDGGRLDLILDAAGAAGDPWGTSLPGAYGAGTAGYIVGTNLDALISSRVATSALPANFADLAITASTGLVSVGSLANDSITAAACAADFIGASELASAAAAEIADLIAADWVSGDASPLAIVAALKADAEWTNLATLAAQIGTAGNGLTNLPWNSDWSPIVEGECLDALNAYDPPTDAELDAALAALDFADPAAIAAAVVDEIRPVAVTFNGQDLLSVGDKIKVKQRDDYSADQGRAFEFSIVNAAIDYTDAGVVVGAAGGGLSPGAPVLGCTASLIDKADGSCTLRLEFSSDDLDVDPDIYTLDVHLLVDGNRVTELEVDVEVIPKYADAPS